ncbi:hypothetical protein GGR52DRAFT_545240 [Hypoxylon sp. FL1284]|nr:hypothetical protein GGR52DRAFT_545240 [Hypoxylon sp. FL1284]
MHFSKSTVLALVPFLSAGILALPSSTVVRENGTVPHDKVSGLLADLDGDGKLDWVEIEGGHFTTIPHEVGLPYLNQGGSGGHSNGTVRRGGQKTTPGGWFGSHSWKSINTVDGHSAKEACINSGQTIPTSLIQSTATSACTAFLSKSAAGVAIDNGWNVWTKSGLSDAAGKAVNINFRWGNLGSTNEISLTQQLCTEIFNTLISGPCGDNGDTQGGSIEVAEKLGFILGFDPNTA